MNLLLTGATGFVGSYILEQLINTGHRITIMKRAGSDTRRINRYLDNITAIEDIRSINNSEVFDCIIHAATSYESENYGGSNIIEANITLPVNLLDYAVKNNCTKFINISTFIAKYEKNPPNRYALTKRHIEEWGAYYSKNFTLSFINVVLHQVYGSGDNNSKFIPWIIDQLKSNVESVNLTEGMQERDFVHVVDVARAINLIVDHKHFNNYEEYEVCSGKTITIKEFVKKIKKITNSSTNLNFGNMAYRDNEIMTLKTDSSKLRGLGWNTSVTFDMGIRKILSEI